jgi:hypothetical protein
MTTVNSCRRDCPIARSKPKIDRRQGYGRPPHLNVPLQVIAAMRTAAGSSLFAMLVAMAPPTAGVLPAFAVEELRAADTTVVEKGYRAASLRGSEVRNERKERIGTIIDVFVYRDLPAAVILQIGGLIGVPSHMIAVPLKSFVLDESGSEIVLPGATRKALEHFPQFTFRS